MRIALDNVGKRFLLPLGQEIPILERIDLIVESGEFAVILGESGCGKSTLLSILAGLIPSTEGTTRVDDQPVTGPGPNRMLLFQQPSLLPWLTVAENIAFGCRLRGDTHGLDDRVRDLVDLMGLAGFEDYHPAALSLGMAQRVALARALIGSPGVLLLDEPFSALDSFHRKRLQEWLIRIWREKRFTAVFVTHDLDEALTLGQRIYLLGGHPARIRDVLDLRAEPSARLNPAALLADLEARLSP